MAGEVAAEPVQQPLPRVPGQRVAQAMVSAVTWNRHLIHYNTEFAISDGLKNVAVHRALIALSAA